MKIFGHPVHMMMIHFPSALFPLDFLSSLGARWMHMQELVNFSFYGLLAGVSLGWLAAIFGMIDLFRVQQKPGSDAVLVRGFIHGSLQVTVLLGYSVLAMLMVRQYPDLRFPELWEIIVKGALVIILLTGNYYGGELVIKNIQKFL